MIISYRHNFVFVRTRKTASSTIEAVLKTSLGQDDIYVEGTDLCQGGHRLENQPSRGVQHMRAAKMAAMIPPDFWKSAFRFTAERHPYEKAVSLAYFSFGKRLKKGKEIELDFEMFLDRIVHSRNYRSYDYYTIDGRVAVTDFVRHETLNADLERIGSKLGIPIPLELPQKKTEFRKDPRPAREILSAGQKRIVYEACREEFQLLKYEP